MQTQVNGFKSSAVAILHGKLITTGTYTDRWDEEETASGELVGTYCYQTHALRAEVNSLEELRLYRQMHKLAEEHYGSELDKVVIMSDEVYEHVAAQDKRRKDWLREQKRLKAVKRAQASFRFLSKDAWKALEKAVQA